MARPKAWIAWSTGKDGAWALHVAREKKDVEIVGMLATITEDYQRVSMHGVRDELLEAQAEAAGFPLHRVLIPANCTNEIYADAMRRAMDEARSDGVTHVVFGDIFLEDVRAYREEKLAGVGMHARFPLWGLETRVLAREMIEGGLRAYVTCLDPRKLPKDLAGRAYDDAFLDALPETADPCGENGEFHTFAWDCPAFRRPVEVRVGETIERGGFVFTDVLAVEGRRKQRRPCG